MDELTEDLDPRVFQTYSELFSPELLGEVYRDFLAQTRERLASMSQGVSLESMRSTAHTIAGTAGMLGAGRIARRAAQLEREESECGPRQLDSLLGACMSLEAQLRNRKVSL